MPTKKKILVCGATGFIGRNIAEALSRNSDYEVVGIHFSREKLENPKIRSLCVDLTDREQVSNAVKGVDIIIQAAAVTSGSKDIVSQPYIHTTDNAVMNSLIFRAAHEHHVSRIIFFSCSIMYQSCSQPVKESDFDPSAEMHPKYFGAGWTKIYIEKMCEFYSRLGRTQYTVIRHSNIFGPHDKYDLERSHVFGATITKVLRSKDGKIVVWGPGAEKRDLLYIDDLVDFVQASLELQSNSFELINVGSGYTISVKELVEKIIHTSGRKVSITYDLSKPNINTGLCLDISKAKKLFRWSPRVSLEEGIKKTIDWYEKNYPS